MSFVILALYAAGLVLSAAGIIGAWVVTVAPARRYKKAKALEEKIEAEFKERIKAGGRTGSQAEAWKSRALRQEVGGGRIVEQVLNGPFFSRDTEERRAYEANQQRRRDLVLVGSGTFCASLGSILSVVFPA